LLPPCWYAEPVSEGLKLTEKTSNENYDCQTLMKNKSMHEKWSRTKFQVVKLPKPNRINLELGRVMKWVQRNVKE